MAVIVRRHELRHGPVTIDGTAQQVLDYALRHGLSIEAAERLGPDSGPQRIVWVPVFGANR